MIPFFLNLLSAHTANSKGHSIILLPAPRENLRRGNSNQYNNCVECGEENPGHVHEHCQKWDEEKKSAIMRYFLRREFFDDLYANNICGICQNTLTTDHDEAKCLMSIAISTTKGFGGIPVRPDFSVGSGLRQCPHCELPYPRHWPGECNYH